MRPSPERGDSKTSSDEGDSIKMTAVLLRSLILLYLHRRVKNERGGGIFNCRVVMLTCTNSAPTVKRRAAA